MTEKRFYKTDSSIEKYRIYDDDLEDAYFISCDEHTIDTLTDLLNEQDQRIKELENTIKKLIIQLFQPPCHNNENDYKELRKFLNEEYDINCTQMDIDVENEQMLFKIEEENND